MAQAVHAAFHFAVENSEITDAWVENSNFLVIVAVPDEDALAALIARARERDNAWLSMVREPDLNNELTAVAFEPGLEAQRLCANLPLALRQAIMT